METKAVAPESTWGLLTRIFWLTKDAFPELQKGYDLIPSRLRIRTITADEMNELSPDVRNWEPFLALTPGGDGLDSYRIISTMLDQFLAVDGLALFEIGHTQGNDVIGIFKDNGFGDVTVHKDLGGKNRVVVVKK